MQKRVGVSIKNGHPPRPCRSCSTQRRRSAACCCCSSAKRSRFTSLVATDGEHVLMIPHVGFFIAQTYARSAFPVFSSPSPTPQLPPSNQCCASTSIFANEKRCRTTRQVAKVVCFEEKTGRNGRNGRNGRKVFLVILAPSLLTTCSWRTAGKLSASCFSHPIPRLTSSTSSSILRIASN